MLATIYNYQHSRSSTEICRHISRVLLSCCFVGCGAISALSCYCSLSYLVMYLPCIRYVSQKCSFPAAAAAALLHSFLRSSCLERIIGANCAMRAHFSFLWARHFLVFAVPCNSIYAVNAAAAVAVFLTTHLPFHFYDDLYLVFLRLVSATRVVSCRFLLDIYYLRPITIITHITWKIIVLPVSCAHSLLCLRAGLLSTAQNTTRESSSAALFSYF